MTVRNRSTAPEPDRTRQPHDPDLGRAALRGPALVAASRTACRTATDREPEVAT